MELINPEIERPIKHYSSGQGKPPNVENMINVRGEVLFDSDRVACVSVYSECPIDLLSPRRWDETQRRGAGHTAIFMSNKYMRDINISNTQAVS